MMYGRSQCQQRVQVQCSAADLQPVSRCCQQLIIDHSYKTKQHLLSESHHEHYKIIDRYVTDLYGMFTFLMISLGTKCDFVKL